jgi:hypothetical protein
MAKELPPSAISVGETDPMSAISSEGFNVLSLEIGILTQISHHPSRYLLLEVLDNVGEVTSPPSRFVKRVPQLVILGPGIVWMEIAEKPRD